MSETNNPPAPSKDVQVRPGGNGDQFLVFDMGDDYRNVELLNGDDARDLYQQLGEQLDDQQSGTEEDSAHE